jgi:medium-chain acyl-[acyl-carrier-protein] hydrolase
MEMIYRREFEITDLYVDCFGRLKPSAILYIAQEAAGGHCLQLGVDWDSLAKRNLFWAVLRHSVRITRLPRRGETVTAETWPMPTTRTAYPRAMVIRDENGQELVSTISLWVLMDLQTRGMVLPGKSGITVEGITRGCELATPRSISPGALEEVSQRMVSYSDLDRNGHMNNTRYLDWVCDLLPSSFHRDHGLKEFTVGYLAESREGQVLKLLRSQPGQGQIQLEAQREQEGKTERVFAARLDF